MKKLITIKLKPNELESVQWIANTNNNEVLIPKSELGLFNEFMSEEEKRCKADYILFALHD